MDNNKIGKTILLLRKEKGLTQQELGNKLFVTDKAVSKWERGLSLPDISILEKLATELDTDVYNLLQIENKKEVDIDSIIEKERLNIKKQLKKRNLKYVIIVLFLFLIMLFKLLPFGYNVEHVRYTHLTNKLINLGVPKFSFYFKNNDQNYSYKNFRGKAVLSTEIDDFLNTLDYLPCNDTIYYYDRITDTTIIDYSVKGNIFYNTISYGVKDGNYCRTLKLKEMGQKLGAINAFHTMKNENISIEFLPDYRFKDSKETYEARMYITTYKNNKPVRLETSTGTFEIKDDELIYYREEIIEKDENLKIPNKSVFIIRNQKLLLKENYLSDYVKEVVLK